MPPKDVTADGKTKKGTVSELTYRDGFVVPKEELIKDVVEIYIPGYGSLLP